MGLTSFVLGNNQWFEADCIQIALANGFVINATTHQTDLVVGGTKYYATKYGKWERGKVTHEKNAVTEMDLLLNCNESIPFPVPQVPGVGVQLASDNFTRANANPISGSWTSNIGAFSNLQIVSNAVSLVSGSTGASFYNGVAFTPDQWSEITIGSTSIATDGPGAGVRIGGAGVNAYVVWCLGLTGGTCTLRLAKYVAGAYSILQDNSATVNTGAKLRLEVQGSMLVVRLNGVLITQVTDTSLAAGTPGMLAFDNTTPGSTTITGWSGGNIIPANASTDNLLASDNFTRANANPISGPWTNFNSVMQLVSNAATGTTTGGVLNAAYFNGVTWPNDQWSEITIGAAPTGSDSDWAIVRYNNTGGLNIYALYVNGPLGSPAIALTKYVNGGAGQVLASIAGATVNAGDKLRLEVQGTQLTARQNGTIIMQVSDSSIASGSAGMGVVNGTIGSATITKWQGGSITQGNPNVAIFQRSKLFLRSKVTVTTAYLDLNTQTVQGTYVAFFGYITQPTLESSIVTFKCSDPGYLMQLNWPRRVIQSACPYALFDANCTLNKSAFQQTRTVAYGSSGTNLVISSALAAIGNDSLPFTQGYIVPVTGQCAGFSIPITNQISSTQLTLGPFDLPLQVGDQIVLVPGCNHLFTTCQLKYNNIANFGGFPFVPGPESSLTGN